MVNYIETKTKDGQPIRIEVESASKGVGFSSKSNPNITDNGSAYEQTLSTIKACASGVIDTLQGLETPPQNASVSFAIKIDGEVGALIAKSAENAQFKVSLSWKQPGSEKEDKD